MKVLAHIRHLTIAMWLSVAGSVAFSIPCHSQGCEGQIPAPGDTMRGLLQIILKPPSWLLLDREGVAHGSLITGLASLDSLNRQTGLIGIEPPHVSPLDTLISPKLVYLFRFAETADLPHLAELYGQNEHVQVAEILVYGGLIDESECTSAVKAQGWGELKQLLIHSWTSWAKSEVDVQYARGMSSFDRRLRFSQPGSAAPGGKRSSISFGAWVCQNRQLLYESRHGLPRII